MTTDDPIKSWIEERRAIHAKVELKARVESDRGTIYTAWTGAHDSGGLPEDDREHIADSYAEGAEAITDALNMFPRALNALEQVLRLHTKSQMQKRIPRMLRADPNDIEPYNWCDECNDMWPCPTVRAIEGAIEGEH